LAYTGIKESPHNGIAGLVQNRVLRYTGTGFRDKQQIRTKHFPNCIPNPHVPSAFVVPPELTLPVALTLSQINLRWTGDLPNLDDFLKVFTNGYDEMIEFAGLPPSSTKEASQKDYAYHHDQLAGQNAYRDLFSDDDLAHLSGHLMSVNVPGSARKMRIRDDVPIGEQAQEFCEENSMADCEPVRAGLEDFMEAAGKNNPFWVFTK
jgi:hypothetical protein